MAFYQWKEGQHGLLREEWHSLLLEGEYSLLLERQHCLLVRDGRDSVAYYRILSVEQFFSFPQLEKVWWS